jgi:hypothetical protein
MEVRADGTSLHLLRLLLAAALVGCSGESPRPKPAPAKPRDVRKEVAALYRLNPRPTMWAGVSGSGKEVLRAVSSSAFGYRGEIVLFAVLDPSGRCLGVNIVREDESPDYMVGVRGDEFLSQFVGKGEDDIALAPEGPIDAVSGATKSSTAVVKAVRQAMRRSASAAKTAKAKGTIDDVVTWRGLSRDGSDVICTFQKNMVQE